MLRQTVRTIMPAAGDPGLNLDPHALPAFFTDDEPGADGGFRRIELTAERVIIRRVVGGLAMKIQVPVSLYRGVAVRVGEETDGGQRVEIALIHDDPALSIPVFSAGDGQDVVAEWQIWARVTGLPMLIDDGDGPPREAFERIGKVLLGTPGPRRRRRSSLRGRRPQALMRRKVGRPVAGLAIHREREIIARA